MRVAIKVRGGTFLLLHAVVEIVKHICEEIFNFKITEFEIVFEGKKVDKEYIKAVINEAKQYGVEVDCEISE